MADALQKLLKVLADGEFHSGEELGELLGVSRTAVWKHLQKLADLPLEVEKVKGRGYCVPGGFELLDAHAIRQRLSVESEGLIAELSLLHSTESTNSVARQSAEQGTASGLVVMAERQTAGRGRRGRQWVSPFARNLYMSTVWGFEGGAAELEGLSLAVGVAVKRAVARCGLTDVQLKWPNDILHQRRKLGGILLEMIGDPSGFCQVVVGVGLNVAMPRDPASAIDQEWTDLANAVGQPVSRNLLAACLLDELMPVLAGFHCEGFASYREEWQRHDAFRGERVRLSTPNREIEGVACGVSDSGALCLEIDGEQHCFNGGELSLRRVE